MPQRLKNLVWFGPWQPSRAISRTRPAVTSSHRHTMVSSAGSASHSGGRYSASRNGRMRSWRARLPVPRRGQARALRGPELSQRLRRAQRRERAAGLGRQCAGNRRAVARDAKTWQRGFAPRVDARQPGQLGVAPVMVDPQQTAQLRVGHDAVVQQHHLGAEAVLRAAGEELQRPNPLPALDAKHRSACEYIGTPARRNCHNRRRPLAKSSGAPSAAGR